MNKLYWEMNMFLSLISKRRSIRKFKNHQIEQEKIKKLAEAALRSPSSRNRNPWEFIFVSDQELLKKLSISKKHGSAFLRGAPLGVVVLADPNKCDVWVEDASIASTYLFLQAEDLDLGACWIQIRGRMHNDEISSDDFVKELLNIPVHYNVESIIAIGYADETRTPLKKENLETQKLFINEYGNYQKIF